MSHLTGGRSIGAADDETGAYLTRLGERVRDLRARRGMTRKALARESGLSERYLAELETGRGNISILLLRQLCRALDAHLDLLVYDGEEPDAAMARAMELLRALPPADMARATRLIAEAFSGDQMADRTDRIALIGLRGAGKSTLGARLAHELGRPFIELDRLIEAEAGVPLGEVFDLYGQQGFRRLERRCLDQVIAAHKRAVIATGGGLVSDAATFARLRAACFTIWIKASPGEHMERVIAQGDMRPMAQNRESMADLRRILRAREPLYATADAQLDTQGQSLTESVATLLVLAGAQAQ